MRRQGASRRVRRDFWYLHPEIACRFRFANHDVPRVRGDDEAALCELRLAVGLAAHAAGLQKDLLRRRNRERGRRFGPTGATPGRVAWR